MLYRNLVLWIYILSSSYVSDVFAGRVTRIYIKDNKQAVKNDDVEVVCEIDQFSGSDIVYVYKLDVVLDDLTRSPVTTQCSTDICTTKLDRHTFTTSSSSVRINVKHLNRSSDQKWWIYALRTSKKQLFLTVYTLPVSLVLSGDIHGGDLQNVNVTLQCQTSNCVYPAPSQILFFCQKETSQWQLCKKVAPSGSQTSCDDSEKKYNATLQLPRYTIWPLQPSNVETIVKFQCRLEFPTLQSSLQSAESGNVAFAVQVISVTLKDGSNIISEPLQVVSGIAKTLVCETSVSRPTATVVWYIGKVEKQRSNSSTSFTFIPQNSDHNKQIFCKAFNIQPESQAVTSNKTTLHVQDAAINMSFYIEGHVGETNVTVDEHDAEIRFKCNVESELTPSVKITFKQELVKDLINESSLLVIQQDVSCFETGVYMCEGRNYFRRSSIFITLLVRCSPRPYRQILRNIGSNLHVPVTLSFTALALPEPGPKGFSWDKKEDQDWQTLLSNADLKIFSSGLQSNLTIMNVSTADFGHYRISVSNDIGTYKQSFYLYERGMPQTNKENGTVASDNAILIVAITLGVISVALAIYASYITVSRYRLKRKGTSSANGLALQTTYANQTFDVSGCREHDGSTDSGEAATLQQYTDLIQCANTDKDTYEV